MIGIYKITNQLNNKTYIGQSCDIERRWREHRNSLYSSHCYDYPLYRALRKYGLENFSFEILEKCSLEELNDKERDYIDKYNSILPNGYNQTLGGQNSKPSLLTKEEVKEIKDLLKTSSLTQEEIGHKFSVSQNTISDINTGYTWIEKNCSYPIRKYSISKKKYFCIDCGKEISKKAERCKECHSLHQRKSIRPSREELKKKIREKSFLEIGREYGVSDNAIRKWCISEKLPHKKSDIKKICDKEWEQI